MLYIHIGMGMADSSTLQYVLDANEERLRELHLEYPKLGRANVNHHPLALELQGRGNSDAPLWPRMQDHLRESQTDVILSSEAFEGVEPHALREALGATKAQIICYVRPPAATFPAFYSQNTKFGLNVSDFDTLYESQDAPSNRKWRYADFLAPWVEAFDASAVRVRSVESELLEGGDLLVDFLHAVGRPVDSHGMVEPPGHDTREQPPSWKLVEALRHLHLHSVGGGNPQKKHADPVMWSYLRRMFTMGTEVAADLGWTEPGVYLNEMQYDELAGLYEEQCAEIDALGVNAQLKAASGDERVVREFLPSADAIPDEERLRFLEAMAPKAIHLAMASNRDAEGKA